MSRGTRLDRADWSTIQHGTGVPVLYSTRGNLYIDDATGIVWTRPDGGVWGESEYGDLWTLASGTLSPSTAGTGLEVITTDGKDINLVTGDTGSNSGNISLIASGNDLASGGDINLTATGGHADLNFITSGSNADVSFTTTGASGRFDVTTTSSGDGGMSFTAGDGIAFTAGGDAEFSVSTSGNIGTISLTSGGGVADINLTANGTNADINLSASGGSADILLTTNGGSGLFLLDTTAGAVGNATFDLTTIGAPGTTGIFSVDGRNVLLNGRDGTVITNSNNIAVDGAAFLKIGGNATSEPVHLYSSHSDILLETVEVSCELDIRLVSCDDIITTAVGETTIDSGFNSHFTITSNDVNEQVLLLSATNAGAGKGTVNVLADNDISIDKTLDNVGTIDIGVNSGDNTSILIGGGVTTDCYVNLGSGTGGSLLVSSGDTSISSGNALAGDLTVDISCVNTGAGDGILNLSATNNINIDKTVDAIGILAFGGPNSGDNTSVIIGPGYAEANSSVVMTSGSIHIGGTTSTDLKLLGSDAGELALTLTASNGGAGNGVVNLVADELQIGGVAGATGTFLSADSIQKTITVTKGIITSIV